MLTQQMIDSAKAARQQMLDSPHHNDHSAAKLLDWALTAVATAVPTPGWQPIETAPVDTKVIMLWRPINHEDRPMHKEIVIGVRCSDHAGNPDGKVWANQYYDEATHVTHWMPLPAAPALAAKEQP